MTELVTTDTILNWMQEKVENKEPLDAHRWVDAGLKLNVLISDEHDKLYHLEQKVAQDKVELLGNSDMSVAKANTLVEASNTYRDMRKQKARIEQIEEFIRLAKLQAKLKSNEYGNYS